MLLLKRKLCNSEITTFRMHYFGSIIIILLATSIDGTDVAGNIASMKKIDKLFSANNIICLCFSLSRCNYIFNEI